MSRDRSKFNGHDFKPRTEEERTFCRQFDFIFDTDAVELGSLRRPLPVAESVRQLFDRVEAKGDEGYRLAARLLREEIENRNASRTLLSQVLTSISRRLVDDEPTRRIYVDAKGRRCPLYPESRIHHVGRVLAHLIVPPPKTDPKDDRVVPEIVVWCENMETGIADKDGSTLLERQETSVIRGSLFSSAIDHRRTAWFWELAFAAKRFPWRIFSDPCRSEGGTIFSTNQCHVISTILGHAPEATARKIAGQVVDCAVHKRVQAQATGLLPYDVTVPASYEERHAACLAIAGGIDVPERRALVREMFAMVLQRPE